MVYLSFDITVEEPAMFAQLEGEPNSAVSYDFIPGSAIRGLFISSWVQRNGTFDATDKVVNGLFFSDNNLYLNAYPLIDGRRSLPAPMSWQKDKYSNADTENKIIDVIYLKEGTPPPLKLEKPQRIDRFAILDGDNVRLTKVDRILNVHTTRARRNPNEQQVFRYDAIMDKQTFGAVIICKTDKEAIALKELLSRYMTIGGVRSAGYGLININNIEISADEYTEVAHSLDSEITITLLSDMILRGKLGEYVATPETLQGALFEQYQIDTKLVNVITDTIMVGGFNRKWGLPLPQTPSLKRGSVLKLEIINEVSEETLWELIDKGLGERRNEGFGRIGINRVKKPEDAILTIQAITTRDEIGNAEIGDDELSQHLWKQLTDAIEHERGEKNIAKLVYDNDALIIKGEITPTQLSRLRKAISDAKRQDPITLEPLQDYLDDVYLKAAGKALDNARVGHDSLRDWIIQIMATKDQPATVLLQLIDSVLARTQKSKTFEAKREAMHNG